MIRVAAIVCARNEAIHISRCLRDLIAQGMEVVLIDHESTDDTVKKARPFLGKGLIDIRTLAWKGEFDLTAQLAFKKQVVDSLDHNWIIHVDADEHLHAANEGEHLPSVMERAEKEGYNCLNFNEFVFAAGPEQDFYAEGYEKLMRTYYHFRPVHPRLMRAFKRETDLENVSSGGHRLAGDRRLYPFDQVLRHYIMLSYAHGVNKYVGRVFARREVERGWHKNRLTISAQNLQLKPNAALLTLPTPDSRAFSIDLAVEHHFWEW